MRKATALIVTIAVLLFGAQALVVNAGGFSSARDLSAPNPQTTATATADAEEDATATTGADDDAAATTTAATDDDDDTAATATTAAPGSLPNTGATSSYPLLILLGVVLLTLGLGVIALLTFRRSAKL
jgi:LPXTG-motif cell wall-anchored protein